MTIKAIETKYAGCRFRSRLEARWAVFFDRLGISWEYESEGCETPDGWYLPDFRLKLHNRFVLFEIKPDHGLKRGEGVPPTDDRWRHVAVDHELYVAYGLPRLSKQSSFLSADGEGEFFGIDGFPRSNVFSGFAKVEPNGESWWLNLFCQCPRADCGAIDISNAGCMLEDDPDSSAEVGDWPFTSRGERFVCCHRKRYGHRAYHGSAEKVLRAYDAARAARFEHGENPL